MVDKKKCTDIISSHSILIGLTPVIPIPFADDIAKSYFQRRMARKIASEYGQNLSNEDLKALTSEKKSGCLTGCLTSILFYPLKVIFRKIFFFLEIKRSVDTISQAYHQGYLLECAFEQGLCQPIGQYNAQQIHDAIEATCQEVGTNPIEKAVQATVKHSKKALKDVAEILWKNLSRVTGQPNEEQLLEAAESAESVEQQTGITQELKQALVDVPPDYFQELNEKFVFHLKTPKNTQKK